MFLKDGMFQLFDFQILFLYDLVAKCFNLLFFWVGKSHDKIKFLKTKLYKNKIKNQNIETCVF